MENPTKSDIVFDNPKKNLVLKLYQKYYGNVSKTCRKVEIHKDTFYHWKNTDEAFKNAIESIQFDDDLVDLAEQQMVKLIKGHKTVEQQVITTSKGVITKVITKEHSPSESLVKYLLENKGKNRGYSPKKDDENKPVIESELAERERILKEMLDRLKSESNDRTDTNG